MRTGEPRGERFSDMYKIFYLTVKWHVITYPRPGDYFVITMSFYHKTKSHYKDRPVSKRHRCTGTRNGLYIVWYGHQIPAAGI